jgi:predicted nucleotidyltransferase
VVDLALVERLLRESLPYAHRVVNAYLVGSRAYGLATPESDYDVTVVIESAYDLVGLQFLAFDELNLNLNLFHLAYFTKLIQQNVVWILTV